MASQPAFKIGVIAGASAAITLLVCLLLGWGTLLYWRAHEAEQAQERLVASEAKANQISDQFLKSLRSYGDAVAAAHSSESQGYAAFLKMAAIIEQRDREMEAVTSTRGEVAAGAVARMDEQGYAECIRDAIGPPRVWPVSQCKDDYARFRTAIDSPQP